MLRRHPPVISRKSANTGHVVAGGGGQGGGNKNLIARRISGLSLPGVMAGESVWEEEKKVEGCLILTPLSSTKLPEALLHSGKHFAEEQLYLLHTLNQK